MLPINSHQVHNFPIAFFLGDEGRFNYSITVIILFIGSGLPCRSVEYVVVFLKNKTIIEKGQLEIMYDGDNILQVMLFTIL